MTLWQRKNTTSSVSWIENFDSRAYREEAGREVWGYVEYSEPLTDKQVAEYDLVKGGEVHD